MAEGKGHVMEISHVFLRPFVKRFALYYQNVVCPVCDVGVLWPNGWTDQDETWHGGWPRPRPNCVRWGPSSLPSPKGYSPSPQFLAHVCCGQRAGCIRIPLGTEVGLSPGEILLDGCKCNLVC